MEALSLARRREKSKATKRGSGTEGKPWAKARRETCWREGRASRPQIRRENAGKVQPRGGSSTRSQHNPRKERDGRKEAGKGFKEGAKETNHLRKKGAFRNKNLLIPERVPCHRGNGEVSKGETSRETYHGDRETKRGCRISFRGNILLHFF